MKRGPNNLPIAERLIAKSALGLDGCWRWTAGVSAKGYGRINILGTVVLAHRASFLAFRGPIKNGLCVLHKCDVPACINPSHLFLGTLNDNNQDAVNKRRHAFGERAGMAKLTNEVVKKIRADKRTHKQIAADYCVDTSLISYVKARKIWRHV